jgi:predicted phage baseplate assembly protein
MNVQITEGRRNQIRQRHANGIDAVEVSDDGRTLTVTFLGRAPRRLRANNVRIDGGRRITGIQVTDVELISEDDPDLDDQLLVSTDRAGDTSGYTLRIVEADARGRPGERPYPGFDPRYARAGFRFGPQRPADVDCRAVEPDQPPAPERLPIDYTARDYPQLRRLLLDRLSLTSPDWVERHAPDLQVTLVELLAYAGDQLSYQQDAVATEAYLDTARLRTSVRRHARLIDYPMHDGVNARAFVTLLPEEPTVLAAGSFRFAAIDSSRLDPQSRPALPTVLPDDQLRRLSPSMVVEVFEPLPVRDLRLAPEHSWIRFWTWGDEERSLPVGSTEATLRDSFEDGDPQCRSLRLEAGDLLLIEEVIGPRTGVPADADPSHRQVVRLTSVTPGFDALYDQPVLHVTWAAEDALGFTVQLTTDPGDCDDCAAEPSPVIRDLSIARGNVVAVDHGRSLTFDDQPAEELTVPESTLRYRPRLHETSVTQAVSFPDPAVVATGQARLLLTVAERARARLAEFWRALRDGDEPPELAAELGVLFGPWVLDLLSRHHPARVLRELIARFDVLLKAKLDRLDQLIVRAEGGEVLGPEIAWELRHSWGERYAGGLDPDDPALAGPAAALATADPRTALPALTVTGRTRGGEPVGDWQPRRDLLGSAPRDRHLVGELSDDGELVLRFSDGGAGLPPPPGGTLAAAYRIGNGTAGNVGAEAISHLVLASGEWPAIRQVRNPLPASGGVDPESLDDVRRLAPLAISRKRLRAITAADYAELAGLVPGVQRAAAQLRWSGSGTEVHVGIDPLGLYSSDAAGPALLERVRRALDPVRRIGHTVVVEPARLVPLDLELAVCVDPGHRADTVLAGLRAALGTGRLPGGGLAFFHPDALTFGEPVRLSRLVAVAAAVPGVLSAEVTRLQRLFGPDQGALERGLLPLGPTEIAQLENSADRPEAGRLRIDLGGGR